MDIEDISEVEVEEQVEYIAQRNSINRTCEGEMEQEGEVDYFDALNIDSIPNLNNNNTSNNNYSNYFSNSVIELCSNSIESSANHISQHQLSNINLEISAISSSSSQALSNDSPIVSSQNCGSNNNNSSASGKRKYIKRTLAKFTEKPQNFDSKRSSQLISSPLYEPIRNSLPFILIGGDFLYHLHVPPSPIRHLKHSTHQHSLQIEAISHIENGSQNAQILSTQDQYLNLFKEIVAISKFGSFISVKVVNKLTGIIDFRSFISAINEMMSARSGENHIDLLLRFQAYLDRCSQTVHRIISLYPNYDDLIALQQRRLEYIKTIGKANLEKSYLPNEDYIALGMTMIDLNTKIPTLENICFNKNLVDLIGSSFDHLETYFLRRGLKEFFDFETRLTIQQQHIVSLINKQNELFEHPFTLITYDDYQIPCFIRIESMFTALPDELKYDRDGLEDPFDIQEGGFVAKLIITDQQLIEIAELRRIDATNDDDDHDDNQECQVKNKSVTTSMTKKQTQQVDDLCYTMQSQYLIEKYYPNEFKNIVKSDPSYFNYTLGNDAGEAEKEEQKRKEEQAERQNQLRCKYKLIDKNPHSS